jgi:membrane-associated phospholipid phosphatase
MASFSQNNKVKDYLYQSSGVIARIVSSALEPYTVGTLTLLLIMTKIDQTNQAKITWLLVAFFVGVLPPLIVLVYEKRSGKISDWFMSVREQRRDVQLAWVFGSGVFTALALIYGLPRLISALSLSFFFLSLAITVITFYWKISVHTAIISLSVLALLLSYSSDLTFLVVLIFLVAWARIRLGAHTLSQVSGGALLAILITYFWFNFFGLATF